MPPTKLHALKTSSSRVCRESGSLAFGSFAPIEQPRFPEFCIRESPASSAGSLLRVHREVHPSRRSTRRSSERLDSAAVFGFPPLHASGESQLPRHSRSGIIASSGVALGVLSSRLSRIERRLTMRCSELLRRVTPAAPDPLAALAPSHLSAAGAPRLRSR